MSNEFKPPLGELPDLASINLRIGARALQILHLPLEQAAMADERPIALISLEPDSYTLAGNELAAYATRLQAPLLPARSIDLEAVRHQKPTFDSVRLVLGRQLLQALTATKSEMDGWCPPRFGLVPFENVWRMAGDLVADYVESQGVMALRGSHLDYDGSDIRGENNVN